MNARYPVADGKQTLANTARKCFARRRGDHIVLHNARTVVQKPKTNSNPNAALDGSF